MCSCKISHLIIVHYSGLVILKEALLHVLLFTKSSGRVLYLTNQLCCIATNELIRLPVTNLSIVAMVITILAVNNVMLWSCCYIDG